MNTDLKPPERRWLFELALFLLLLATAIAFRFYKIGTFPGGLHYDEAIDLRQSLRILSGDIFIFTREGWGREALYYYLVAPFLRLIPDNVLALRTAVGCLSVGVAVSSTILAWRFTDRLTAWLTLAWFAVTYWSVFLGRLAVRGITLSFVLGFAAIAFWNAWQTEPEDRKRYYFWWVATGILLGLSLYTYQPARITFLGFLSFGIYLFLFHRVKVRRRSKELLGTAAIALITAIPLAVVLLSDPSLEGGREWSIAPLRELLSGNPDLVFENLYATAKAFTIRGDPLIADNIPQRPIFVPAWTSIFFYAGVVIALFRWRRAEFAFVLLWLVSALMPTIVTTSAPNFNRMVAALFPVSFLSAIPVSELRNVISRRWGQPLGLLPVSVAIIALIVTAQTTWRDYFDVWPETRPEDYVHQYNLSIEEMANFLGGNEISVPILIDSRHLEDSHPYILSASLDDPHGHVRWGDTSQSIIRPAGANRAILMVENPRSIDERFLPFLTLRTLDKGEYFQAFEISYDNWPSSDSRDTNSGKLDEFGLEDGSDFNIEAPVNFNGLLQLEAVYDLSLSAEPGAAYSFLSGWRVLEDGSPLSLAIFVHLLDKDGAIIAQQDGLGYPPHSWKSGDSFLHLHTLNLPADLDAGVYQVQMGLYERDSGRRWPIIKAGSEAGQQLLLGEVTIR